MNAKQEVETAATGAERRASYDLHDDGSAPVNVAGAGEFWPIFKAWAADNLGQGYSLAVSEGSILDPVTSWSFRTYCLGRRTERGEPATSTPSPLCKTPEEIARLQNSAAMRRAQPVGLPCDVVVKPDRFEVKMTGGSRFTLFRKSQELPSAREVKNRLVIDGVVDAAFAAILQSSEPDATHALVVGLAHDAVDATFSALNALPSAGPASPVPLSLDLGANA